jgi:hypothetical protein
VPALRLGNLLLLGISGAQRVGAVGTRFSSPTAYFFEWGITAAGASPSASLREFGIRQSVPCLSCEDCGWVCDAHPRHPWDACGCGADGKPCPRCNAQAPRALPFIVEVFTETIRVSGITEIASSDETKNFAREIRLKQRVRYVDPRQGRFKPTWEIEIGGIEK